MDEDQKLFDTAANAASELVDDFRGATVERWYVIVERALPSDDAERVVSIYRSPNIQPWDAMGLLGFAQTIETGVVNDTERSSGSEFE